MMSWRSCSAGGSAACAGDVVVLLPDDARSRSVESSRAGPPRDRCPARKCGAKAPSSRRGARTSCSERDRSGRPRHVDRLDAGDGSFVVEVIRSCSSPISVARFGWYPTRSACDPAAPTPRNRLGEAEDVVDEQQHVLAVLVAEVLGGRERRERHAEACAGGSFICRRRAPSSTAPCCRPAASNPACRARDRPLACPFAHSPEDRHAAVLLRDVVDEFHDENGLADARASEEPDLPAAPVGARRSPP